MKKILLAVLGLWALAFLGNPSLAADKPTPDTVYGFKVRTIDGQLVSLSQYKGKTLLIVNVASKCGFTPQYAGLEKLYRKYKDKGFVILGFPCNQFLSQEPGTDKEIKTFCTTKYDVTFPLFDKLEVNGDNANPLYQFLKKAEPEPDGKLAIGWNFTKFLISRDGHPLKRFVSKVKPEDIDTQIAGMVSK